MVNEVVQAGRFENTRVFVHRRSQKQGRRVDGRYIRVGGVFKLGSPPLKSLQFIGVHEHMFMTISYPDHVRGILDVAADLPGHQAFGQFTWASPLTLRVRKADLVYFIPTTMWGFLDGEYEKTMRTHSTLSILQGLSGEPYYLLNMPLLTRKYLRARYKRKTKKPK